MTATEDRLRDAFRADAQTIRPETIRPAPALSAEAAGRPPAPGPAGRAARRAGTPGRLARAPGQLAARRPRRLAAALTAAAAVLVITIAAVMAGTGAWPGPPPRPGRPTSEPRDLGRGFPGGRVPSGPMPGFFAGIRPGGNPGAYVNQVAIYSSATGRITGRLTPPEHGRYFQAVAATGSDQVFLAAATPARPGPANCRTWLYPFLLSSSGRPEFRGRWRPLRLSGWAMTTSLVTSGNGEWLVYDLASCGRGGRLTGPSHRGIINLRTGAISALPASVVAGRNPSLSADGRLAGYDAGPAGPGSWPRQAAWAQRLRPRVGSPRKVVTAAGGVLASVLSPTGRITFAITSGSARNPPYRQAIGAYDTASGRLIRVLHRVTTREENDDPFLVADDDGGRYLLMSWLPGGGLQIVDAATGRLWRVPVSQASMPALSGVAW